MRYFERGRELQIPKGTVLFDIDSQPDEYGIFMVVTGRFRLSRAFADGYEMTADEAPGGIFGLVEAMIAKPRIFKAVAIEDSTVYAWPPEGFEHCISVYIELAEVAVQVLSKQMRFVNEGVKALG